MKPEHKKYILENINRKPIKEIAQELNIKERKINKFLQKNKEKKQANSNPQPKTRFKKSTLWVSVILIVVLGFAAYANSLNGQFVWDDDFLVKDNVYIKSWSHIPKIFTQHIASGAKTDSHSYRPLQMFSFMIDYSLWKLDVKGYHLSNILLHILVALSIFWLINILFNDKLLSLLTGILFVLHPIHTEAVSYISGRSDSLSVLFMLLCIIFYIKRCFSKNSGLYILMLLSCILAFLSRENSLILTVLLLFYHYTFKQKLDIKQFSSVLVIACIYMLLRLTAFKSLLPHIGSSYTLLQRTPGFFVAIANYTRILLLPFNLHMEYGAGTFGFLNPKTIIGILILSCLLIYSLRKATTNRLAFFSISWFFITLLPVSNLYPINAYMAEHWLYLPSVGFFLILAKGASYMYRKKQCRILTIIFIIGLIIFYSSLTVRQNFYWREPLDFYERTLKYAAHSARMHNNLGLQYFSTNKKEKAINLYKKAIEINPNYAQAYNNLANAYNSIGNSKEAINSYKKAIEINPGLAEAYNNLGNAYVAVDKEEAIASYKKAIEVNPDLAEAYNNLGNTYIATDKEKAIALYGEAIRINPDYAEAHYNLGVAYSAINKNAEALTSFKRAIEINPNYAKAYNNLSIMYFHNGQYDLAIKYCDRAKELGLVNHGLLEALNPYRK